MAQRVLLSGPAGRLIDGTDASPVSDAAVVLDGDRIAYAGPRSGATWADNAEVIYAGGGTILPGLIDVHVHITNDGGPGKTGAVLGDSLDFPADLALKGYSNALRSLRMGYTTLRNLHAPGYVDLALRDAIAKGRLEGPRLVVCGQGLCITGGHMDKTYFPTMSRWEDGLGFAIRRRDSGRRCASMRSERSISSRSTRMWAPAMRRRPTGRRCPSPR